MTRKSELAQRWIRVAARAPSPHNTQPWTPRIVDGAVELAVVPDRVLWAGDPTFRDLLLALGAWIESFAIAAAAEGFATDVQPLQPLSSLHELPHHGNADLALPVISLQVHAGTYDTPFTPDDVLHRRVHRGRLIGARDVWSEAPGSLSWLHLRHVDPRTMRVLIRLGTAYTASQRHVATELVQWLRLSPRHPRYHQDGMTDAMLVVPVPIARLGAALIRRPRLRDATLALARVVGRQVAAVSRNPLLGARSSAHVAPRENPAVSVRHLALVADMRTIGDTATGLGSGDPNSRSSDRPATLPPRAVVEAGRALQRLWLHAHRNGVAVYPHSEVIDAPDVHVAVRNHLGLQREEEILAVFTAGRPAGPVARSPRLNDAST